MSTASSKDGQWLAKKKSCTRSFAQLGITIDAISPLEGKTMQRSELAHLRPVYTSEHASYTAPCVEKTNWDDKTMSLKCIRKLRSRICIVNAVSKFA